MICFNCGQTFDEADVAHYREDSGEVFSACPFCGDTDIGESQECGLCGEEFDAEELRSGFCLPCLWEEIDYDIALAYANYCRALDELIFCYHLNATVSVKTPSQELESFLNDAFKRFREEDLSFCKKDFLNSCKSFCLPDYPKDWGVEGSQFAEWYDEYLKEHGWQNEQ